MKPKAIPLLFIISLLLVSCSTDEFAYRLTGTWVMSSIYHPWSGVDGVEEPVDYSRYGTYEFKPDGTLIVQGNLDDGFYPNGTYTWEIKVDYPSPVESPVERLYIDNVGFLETVIEATRMVLSDVPVDGCRYELRKVSAF